MLLTLLLLPLFPLFPLVLLVLSPVLARYDSRCFGGCAELWWLTWSTMGAVAWREVDLGMPLRGCVDVHECGCRRPCLRLQLQLRLWLRLWLLWLLYLCALLLLLQVVGQPQLAPLTVWTL